MGSAGFSGGPGRLHGRGKPSSCQAAVLGTAGLGTAVRTPVTDVGQTELQNRDAQTDTRRQKIR